MSEFATGALARLLGDQALLDHHSHPPITSPEIKHLAGKMLADSSTSYDARRLAGSVMAHIEREERVSTSHTGILSRLLAGSPNP